MWAYLDSSALAKRYLDGGGRREVLRLLRRYDVVTSAVTAVELRSSEASRVGANARRRASGDDLETVRVGARVLGGDGREHEVLTGAEAVVATHPIRSLDAIHVGSAQVFARRIALPDLLFVTADARQAAAATAVGLTITQIEP